MNTAIKLLQAMARNPHNWRLDQIQTVARHHGISWRQGKGSHWIFVRNDGLSLSIPVHGHTVRSIYIQQFVKLVGEMR